MVIRTLIATALMASACAAHADVIPSSNGAGIVSGSNVAGAVGDSSVIAGVTHGANSEALVQALYQKVSASVGSDMKVSLKQGIDGVYVTGLSTAKAAALAGDGMSVIATPDGYKIVDSSGGNGANSATTGGGANTSIGATAPGGTPNATPADAPSGLVDLAGNTPVDAGVGADAGNGNATGDDNGNGSGSGSGQQAAEVPEPSSIALMLAGMLGVAGLGRRRAR